MRRRPRVGVVLGAGGVVGGAWLAGALAAISAETGWEPGRADVIIGTSAGAVMASLLASGMPASRLVPRAPAPDRDWPLRELATAEYRGFLPAALPRPGSVALALSAIGARGHWARSVPVLAALSPRGSASTVAISGSVRRELAGRRWPDHPACWIVATEYRTGRRAIFGRDRTGDIATAVAASCAIPGYFRPVTIDGREYVDGGVPSPTNADLALSRDLDLVLCLNPLGRRLHGRARGAAAVFEALVRELACRQLEAEAAQLAAAGVAVEILSPSRDELELMSSDPMDSRSCIDVGLSALVRVRDHLRSQGRALGARLAATAA